MIDREYCIHFVETGIKRGSLISHLDLSEDGSTWSIDEGPTPMLLIGTYSATIDMRIELSDIDDRVSAAYQGDPRAGSMLFAVWYWTIYTAPADLTKAILAEVDDAMGLLLGRIEN